MNKKRQKEKKEYKYFKIVIMNQKKEKDCTPRKKEKGLYIIIIIERKILFQV